MTPEDKIFFEEDTLEHKHRIILGFNKAVNESLLQNQGRGIRGKMTIKPGGIADLQKPLAQFDDLKDLLEQDIIILFHTLQTILEKRTQSPSKDRTPLISDFYHLWHACFCKPSQWKQSIKKWDARILLEKENLEFASKASRVSTSLSSASVSNSASKLEEKLILTQPITKLHLEWLCYQLETVQFWYAQGNEKREYSNKLNALVSLCQKHLASRPPSFAELHALFNPTQEFFKPSTIDSWQTKLTDLIVAIKEHCELAEKANDAHAQAFSHPLIFLLENLTQSLQISLTLPQVKRPEYYQNNTYFSDEKEATRVFHFLKSTIHFNFIPSLNNAAEFALYSHLKNVGNRLTYFLDNHFLNPSAAIAHFEIELKHIQKSKNFRNEIITSARRLLNNLIEKRANTTYVGSLSGIRI